MKKRECFFWNWKIPGLQKVLLMMKITVFFLLLSVINVFANKTYSQTELLNLYSKNPSLKEEMGTTHEGAKNDGLAQQQNSVSGTVTDESGQPLPGVTVMVKGTNKGTVTNTDGNYTLSDIPENATLQFSFIGMRIQEVVVGNKTNINVSLAQETIGIDEVVAIGYATREKGRLTGSVSSVSGELVDQSPSVDVAKSLQGRLPGLKVNDRGGEPGNPETEILIRGKSTLGNNSPLIVIDGVPRSQTDFTNLSSEDIADISILKDAAAAIYGARAANGVILVVTKRGKSGVNEISIDSNYGLSTFARVPNLMNSYQFAVYKNEIEAGFGRSPFFSEEDISKFQSGDYPLTHGSPNWYEYTYRDFAPQTQHTVSASGGSDKIKYFLSGEYLNKGSQYWSGDSSFDRYQVRSNIDAQVAPWLKLGVDLSGSVRKRHYPQFQPWYEILQIKPYAVATFPNGEYGSGIANINFRNVTSDRSGYQEEFDKSLRSVFSFNLNMDWLTKGLSLLGNASFDFDDNNYMMYFEPSTVYDMDKNTGELIQKWGYGGSIRTLTKQYNLVRDQFSNIRLDYEKTFEDHNFTAFLGYEQSQGYNEMLQGFRRNVVSKLKLDLDLAGTDQQSSNGNSGEYGRVNYFGSIGYDYQRKYLIDLTFRRDGSYNFPNKGRFGNFPSVSVGWTISKERFMASTDTWLDNLKLRTSYAMMGNDRIESFQYLAKYNLSDFHIFGENGGARYDAFVQANVPNPDITWEKSKNFNVGFDANMFDNKLVVNFDYFYEKRRDILITRNASIPNYTGLQLPQENLGKVDNEGVEIVANYQNNIGDFYYTIGGNFQYSDNRIVYIDEPANVPEYRKAEGKPIDSKITYKTNGIFHDANDLANPPEGVVVIPGQEPGDLRYVDVNKDGRIDGEDQYRRDISATPKIQYGFNPSLQYKGINVNLFFYGQAMVETPVVFSSPVTRLNVPSYYFDLRWTENNMDGPFPRAYPGINDVNTRNSDFWFFNSAYIALKNVTLSYTLPSRWTSRINFNSVQFYAKASDLWILWDGISARTGQKDLFPELGTSDLGGSVAWNPAYYYPQTTTVTFGVRINLSN